MSDIDFDELDKAVNTLMGDVPKVDPTKADDIKTLTINSTLPDDARPSLAKLDSTLAAVNGPAARPLATSPQVATSARTATSSLATRRGGRFMDVVHPSSDMKTAAKPSTVSSRQGVTIEPTSKLLPQTTDDQSDVNASPEVIVPESNKDLTASDVISQPKDHDVASSARDDHATDWPDPLEMSGYSAEPDMNNVEPVAQQPTSMEIVNKAEDESADMSALAANDLDYEDSQPLTSPFITDAKVEKRPLGGAPTEVPAEELGHAPVLGALAADDDTINVTDPADQLPATPGVIEVQLPPELQSDLMAIETDGGTSVSNAIAVEPTATSTDNKSAAEAPTAATIDGQPSTVSATSAGPTSIPQQYHEAPSTSDESNGSIYDTASYHQPLAHPAKTKSGWLWIIWILLLLIVGGGGAVALYFIGII